MIPFALLVVLRVYLNKIYLLHKGVSVLQKVIIIVLLGFVLLCLQTSRESLKMELLADVTLLPGEERIIGECSKSDKQSVT